MVQNTDYDFVVVKPHSGTSHSDCFVGHHCLSRHLSLEIVRKSISLIGGLTRAVLLIYGTMIFASLPLACRENKLGHALLLHFFHWIFFCWVFWYAQLP